MTDRLMILFRSQKGVNPSLRKLLCVVFLLSISHSALGQEITGVVFDWSSHDRRAPGSDNWPMTWGDDDQQYTSWGDGGGFDGSNSNGRVSLGFARIDGEYDDYVGHNRWGGVNSDCESQFAGKSYGILSVDGVLYSWVSPRTNIQGFAEQRLYRSGDHACTWTDTEVVWDSTTYHLTGGNFLNFGRDYAGSRDDFVYTTFAATQDPTALQIQAPGEIYLARAHRDSLEVQSAYAWFSSSDLTMPAWGTFEERRPVYEDPTGVSWSGASLVHVPSLSQYVLTTEHTSSGAGHVQMLVGPEPWGPWTEILRESGWPSGGEVEASAFYWSFSPKWFRNGGTEFTLIFTGFGENDSWNSVSGQFLTTTQKQSDFPCAVN